MLLLLYNCSIIRGRVSRKTYFMSPSCSRPKVTKLGFNSEKEWPKRPFIYSLIQFMQHIQCGEYMYAHVTQCMAPALMWPCTEGKRELVSDLYAGENCSHKVGNNKMLNGEFIMECRVEAFK